MILENNDVMRELYTKYFVKMKHICQRYFPDKDDAYDTCLDIFMDKIFPQLDKIRAASNEEAFIRTVVKNACIDKLRSSKDTTEYVQKTHGKAQDEPVSDWVEKMDKNKLHAAIEQLPQSYKRAIRMYYLQDKTHDQIANEFGISVSASKTNLMKAKHKLKELLAAQKELVMD